MHRALLLAVLLSIAAAGAQAQRIAAGPEVPIGRDDGASSGNVLSTRYLSAIASTGSMALAVWIDSRESAIYATRVGSEGRPLDPFSIRIAPVTQPQQLFVKWNGTRFVIVWESRHSEFDYRVAATEVTAEGRVLQPGGAELANGRLFSVAAGFGRTAIVAKPPTSGQCVAGTILLLGDGLALQTIPNPAPPCNNPRVTVNGYGFITMWFQFADLEVVGRDLWGQRFRATGEIVDAAPLLLARALDLPSPTVTFGDAGGSSLIHVSDYNYSSMIRVSPELSVARMDLGAPIGRDAQSQIEALDDGRYALSWTSTLRILGTDDRAQQNVGYGDYGNVSAALLGSRVYVTRTSSGQPTLMGAFLDSPSETHALSLMRAPAESPVIAATPGGGLVSAWQSGTFVHAATMDPGAQQFSPAVSLASHSSAVLAVAADDLGTIVASTKFDTGELEVLRLDHSLALSKSGTFLPVDGGSRVALASNGYVVIAAWMNGSVPYWSSAFPDGVRFFNYVTPSKARLLSLASNGRDFVILAVTPEQRLHVTRIAADGIHATSYEADEGVTDAAVCAAGDDFLIETATPAMDTLAIASNGTSALLVWRDAATHQIFATPLDASGAPVGPPAAIAIGEFTPAGVAALADGKYAIAYTRTTGEDAGTYLRIVTIVPETPKASPIDPLS